MDSSCDQWVITLCLSKLTLLFDLLIAKICISEDVVKDSEGFDAETQAYPDLDGAVSLFSTYEQRKVGGKRSGI